MMISVSKMFPSSACRGKGGGGHCMHWGKGDAATSTATSFIFVIFIFILKRLMC